MHSDFLLKSPCTNVTTGFANKQHASICADMQPCVGVFDITNKLKKILVFPLYSLALIEGICAPGNIGREACVALCLDIKVAHDVSEPVRPPLIVSEFLQCSLRDVRD